MREILRKWKLAMEHSPVLPATQNDVANIKEQLREIRLVIESHELRAAAWHADACNARIKLESVLDDLGSVLRQINSVLASKWDAPVSVDSNDRLVLGQLLNELKRLSDVLIIEKQNPTKI